MSKGWIGVDLDGTLAEYHGWVSATEIGKPIPLMVERVKAWLAEGIKVRIFTARVCGFFLPHKSSLVEARAVEAAIRQWCIEHIGQALEVTCVKDYEMIELWDDRAKQVVPNTGVAIEDLCK